MCPSIWGFWLSSWYLKASMAKKCVYWHDMIVSTDKNVYMEKACVYRKDMYLRTRHVYTDKTFRIFWPILLYRSDDKNDIYIYIYMMFLYLHNSNTSALQQKCPHTSSFINGSCLRTRHWHNLRSYIRPNTALNSEESSLYQYVKYFQFIHVQVSKQNTAQDRT